MNELSEASGRHGLGGMVNGEKSLKECYETSIFISFLDYWQVTLIWSPNGDASLIRSLLIGDTSTTYYTDVAIRVTMTLY